MTLTADFPEVRECYNLMALDWTPETHGLQVSTQWMSRGSPSPSSEGHFVGMATEMGCRHLPSANSGAITAEVFSCALPGVSQHDVIQSHH